MDIRPLKDLVFVRREPPAAMEGRIIIPAKGRKVATRSEVVACGPEVTDVKVGDIVHINPWYGEEVKFPGDPLHVLHADEIEAIEG
jgi:co-chaperonin GroES (HSP10)